MPAAISKKTKKRWQRPKINRAALEAVSLVQYPSPPLRLHRNTRYKCCDADFGGSLRYTHWCCSHSAVCADYPMPAECYATSAHGMDSVGSQRQPEAQICWFPCFLLLPGSLSGPTLSLPFLGSHANLYFCKTSQGVCMWLHNPCRLGGSPPLQSGGQNQKWPISAQGGYITPAAWGGPTA